jgi:hypothetical protein
MGIGTYPPATVSSERHLRQAVEKAASKRVLAALDFIEFAEARGATPAAVATLIAMGGGNAPRFVRALRFAVEVAGRLVDESSVPPDSLRKPMHLRVIK